MKSREEQLRDKVASMYYHVKNVTIVHLVYKIVQVTSQKEINISHLNKINEVQSKY